MKKVVLFGLLGALGCLAGWAAGEPLLRVLIPWAQARGAGAAIVMPPEPPAPAPALNRGGEVPAPEPPPPPEPFRAPPAPPPPSADFAGRLEKAGAGQGQVQIALSWANTNDLDLSVIEPTGNKIWAHAKRSPSGGELDVDSNFTGPRVVLTNEPVEHINYRDGAPEGHYWVYVSHFLKRVDDPTNYKVGLFVNGRWSYYTGAISHNGPAGEKPRSEEELATQLVCEFEVKNPGPELRLSLPSGVSVPIGGSNRFQVQIARNRFDGPVTLDLSGPSHGLNLDAAPIPTGATAGFVTIRSPESLPAGAQVLQLLAWAETPRGRVEAVAPLKIDVLDPPKPAPILKLSVPESVEVYPDGKNTFKVKIGRYFFPEEAQVKVRLDAASSEALTTPSLSIREVTLAPGETEATLQIAASPAALTGIERLRLMAEATTSAGAARAEALLDVLVVPAPPAPPAWPSAIVMGCWTSLLALGLSFALAMGENRALHRPLIGQRQALSLLPRSLAAGLCAGAGGQLSYAALSRVFGGDFVPALGLVAGWLLLGALLGAAIGFYIPNLRRSRAAFAGAVGGFIGVLFFLAFTAIAGPGLGRFAGALILGLAIGAMVALAQVIIREAWLELDYGRHENAEVSLGEVPVTIGSDPASTIYAPGAASFAARYELASGGVIFTDVPANRSSTVPLGATRQIGGIRVTVRGIAQRLIPAYRGPMATSKPITSVILPPPPPPPPTAASAGTPPAHDFPSTPPFLVPTSDQVQPPPQMPEALPSGDIHVIAELDEPPADNEENGTKG